MEEQREKRICEKGIQIENCRKCLFEVLCNYEKMKQKLLDDNK